MLKICLVFWESGPQYAYKRYAYKKKHVHADICKMRSFFVGTLYDDKEKFVYLFPTIEVRFLELSIHQCRLCLLVLLNSLESDLFLSDLTASGDDMASSKYS